MPMVSISKQTKRKLDRLVKLDRRTQGNVIAMLCEDKLEVLGWPKDGSDKTPDGINPSDYE